VYSGIEESTKQHIKYLVIENLLYNLDVCSVYISLMCSNSVIDLWYANP
jgi:hypothetical protein